MKHGKYGESSQMRIFGQQKIFNICKLSGHNKKGCNITLHEPISEVNCFELSISISNVLY